MEKWGLVTTVKAPTSAMLDFAAHHIELGAHRLYIYLDEPDPAGFSLLKAHPKIRVFTCDAAHWRKLSGNRPDKHQVRQTRNATHTYARPAEVDWLAHIDVDEFLWPQRPVGALLSALPSDAKCARIRPIESLSGNGIAFKAFIPAGPQREQIVQRLYPTFGRYVKGGFLSHLAGKLFVRTGLPDVTFRIHNIFQAGNSNPGEIPLDSIDLCHCHAATWDHFFAAYRFRLTQGSYRADLSPARAADDTGLTLHQLFTLIEQDQGADGLRRLYDELCADTPDRRRSLQTEGLLRLCDLDLAAKRRKHFPNFDEIIPVSETVRK